MSAHQFPAGSRRRSAPTEARGPAVASGPRPEALLALLAIVVLLMAVPAVVAAISIVDPRLLAGAGGWSQHVSTWLSYLAHASFVLALPLAAIIAHAEEDE
jgi:ABC-type spermidine/putrescine transport system permease subunit II